MITPPGRTCVSAEDELSAKGFFTTFFLLLGNEVTVPPLRGIDSIADDDDDDDGTDGFSLEGASAVGGGGRVLGTRSLVSEAILLSFFALGT